MTTMQAIITLIRIPIVMPMNGIEILFRRVISHHSKVDKQEVKAKAMNINIVIVEVKVLSEEIDTLREVEAEAEKDTVDVIEVL